MLFFSGVFRNLHKVYATRQKIIQECQRKKKLFLPKKTKNSE